MAASFAPPTTAVLGSVDDAHTGSAPGFDSAVARTGGMIATALLGRLLAAEGPTLPAQFHLARAAAAASAVLARREHGEALARCAAPGQTGA